MDSNWFQNAIAEPWLFITGVLVLGIWRASKWMGKKLFDEETGIITKFFKDIRTDSQEMKASLVKVSLDQTTALSSFQNVVTTSLDQNKDAITSLERQLVSAIQARPDDGELFKVLFTDNPVPITFVGLDNRFIKINHAAEEFFGYSAGELSSMTFEDVTTEADIAADMENVERVRSGALSRYRMEKTYRRKDGTEIPAALYVFRYPESGTFLHYISIVVPVVR